MPEKVSILNVENGNGEGQQFHDRCLVIETASGSEVWALTNSLSTVAKRYPLVITRLDDTAARRLMNYLDSLEHGEVPGRPDMRTVEVWAKPQAAVAKSPTSVSQPGQEWQGDVLRILVTDATNAVRLVTALERELLEPDVSQARTTWRVPEANLQSVLHTMRNHLQQHKADAADTLRALAHWADHGGPAPTDYAFGPWIIDSALLALNRYLAPASARTGDAGAGSLPDVSMPECLDDVRMCLAFNAPGDMLNGVAPEIEFYSHLLWQLSPAAFVEVIDQTRSSELLNWFATYGHSLSPDQQQALLRSSFGRVRALGVAILWDGDANSERRTLDATFSVERLLDQVAIELGQASTPSLDVYLCLTLLATNHARTEVELTEAASCISRHYPGQLEEAGRARLVVLLGKPHPLHTVVRVSAVGTTCAAPDGPELNRWCLDELLRHLSRRGQPTGAGMAR